ncbi:MAG: 50S ribosome-binding GTPase [Candidatus Lokiarchaeota archaeon]|nr:50S ribosome-binding GTPase [Candidatus Lokiarchaeota archaeon]
MTTKITFVGMPEVGKTTIKKVIFEGEDPNKLVLFPLEASVRIDYSVHEFMDSKIVLIDTPGQSLSDLLKDEEKQRKSFENANAIIYIFDYPTYIENSEDIINDIRSIYNINKKHEFGAKIILFLHKVDLIIAKKIGFKLAIVKKQINKLLSLPEELSIHFTSLHPNLIYTIYNALSDTVGTFSEEISNLKDLIKKLIKNLSKTISLVSNKEDNLIIQLMSDDFDTSILFSLYEKIYKLSSSPDDLLSKSNLIILDSKILHAVSANISVFNANFKNITFLSETLERNELDHLIGEIKEILN